MVFAFLILFGCFKHKLCTLVFKGEGNLKQVRERLAHALLLFGGDEEEKKSAAASAKELAAKGAAFACSSVERVNTLVGDAVGDAALDLPSLVKHIAKAEKVALSLKQARCLSCHIPHSAKLGGFIPQGGLVCGLQLCGKAGDARKKQHQVALQSVLSFLCDF